LTGNRPEVIEMYVVVHHTILDAETAFTRGQRLMTGEGAPQGVRVLQFYPSVDHSLVICLWESSTVEDVQAYVDATLGDSSENACYPVDSDAAFAERPLGLPVSAPVAA
jgi:hypothetical protein